MTASMSLQWVIMSSLDQALGIRIVLNDAMECAVVIPIPRRDEITGRLRQAGMVVGETITEGDTFHIVDVAAPLAPPHAILDSVRDIFGPCSPPVYSYSRDIAAGSDDTLLFHDLYPGTHRVVLIEQDPIVDPGHAPELRWQRFVTAVQTSGLCDTARPKGKHLQVALTPGQARNFLATWLLIAEHFPQQDT